MDNLVVLQVVIPLVAAPICFAFRSNQLAWLVATLASIACLGISIDTLAHFFQSSEIISYHMGGWAPPWGIEYHIDQLSAVLLLVISLISTLGLLSCRTGIIYEVVQGKEYLFYVAWLVVLTGLLGIVSTGDMFNVYVFLEISSLATYMLISLNRDKRSLNAAYQYLILGTVGASFLLMGIGLLYQMTGTLNMADIQSRLPAVADTTTITASFVFIFLGVAIKAALFPLHGWLPNAYQYAPSMASVFLAGTATKVGIYILLRFTYTLFQQEISFGQFFLDVILLPLALTSILVASCLAIFQQDIKRILAFSSVAQLGYILLGVAINNENSLTGSVAHIFNHALMKSALFIAAAAFVYRVGSSKLHHIAGMGKHMPLTSAAFMLSGFSLIGIPATAGFISKWYFVLGAMNAHWWPVVIIVLASSLLAAAYVWRIVEALYFKPCHFPNAKSEIKEAPLSMLITMWALSIANVVFGLKADNVVSFAQSTAQSLLGGAF